MGSGRGAEGERGAIAELRKQMARGRLFGDGTLLPRVGPFVLEATAAAGSMGVVFRGRAVDSGELVAVKVRAASSEVDRARFAREAAVLATLKHPNIVRYLDHGVLDGLDYIVMTWLEGRTLREKLAYGPMEITDVVRIARDLAGALDTVHRAGITHRDLKPANVFLESDRMDEVRLIDFGVAHASMSEERITTAGALVGTPVYMAPEQLRGHVEARTDIYALGALMFECLTGKPPFTGTPAALLRAIIEEEAPAVRDARPEVPAALGDLLRRMLAKDIARRPLDMSAVELELGALLTRSSTISGPSRARRSADRSRRPTPPRQGAHRELLGRAFDRAQIEGVLAECLANRSSALVIVTGAPGIGKTALLEDIERRAQQDGFWSCARLRPQGTLDSTLGGERLVVVDDADDLDTQTLGQLRATLAEHPGPLVALVAVEEDVAHLRSAVGISPTLIVELQTLAPRTAARLARFWLPHAPEARIIDLVARSAGNPARLSALCSGDLEGLEPEDT